MFKPTLCGLLAVVTLVCAQNHTSSTTHSPSNSTHFPSTSASPRPSIIFGQQAAQGEIPFQAALFSPLPQFPDGRGKLCGGTLIRQNWVLTAAHCVTDIQETTVGLGSTNRNSMPYSETSTEHFIHEMYEQQGSLYDVALIKLPSPAQGEFIAVAATAASGDFVDVPVRASGFGETESGDISDDLLMVNLRTITNEECVQSYNARSINERTICATWVSREGESTCSGDSGGPLTTVVNGQDVLIGVNSFVHTDGCDSGRPSAYQRVSAYQDWIERTIQANP